MVTSVELFVYVLSSSDVFAANNSDTFAQLEEKHPPPSRTINLPEPPNVFSEWFFSWFTWVKTTTSKGFNW
jgi:hypothetical protein